MPSGLFLNGGSGGGGGGIGGSGTTGKIPKFSGATTLANSLLQDDGTNVSLTSGQFLLGSDVGIRSFADPNFGMNFAAATNGTTGFRALAVGGSTDGTGDFRILYYNIGSTELQVVKPDGTQGSFAASDVTGARLLSSGNMFLQSDSAKFFLGAGSDVTLGRAAISAVPYLNLGDASTGYRGLLSNGIAQGFQTKALTESAATSFCDVSVASGASVAGWVDYEIFAADATDLQSRAGKFYFNAVNKAGAITVNAPSLVGTESTALSTGTLTNAFTATTGASLIHLQANAVSSLTQTTLAIRYRVTIVNSVATAVTPL